MKARYVLTNYPGVKVDLRVEFDDGQQSIPLDLHPGYTVFDATQYVKNSLAARHASTDLQQTWIAGVPSWVSEWIELQPTTP